MTRSLLFSLLATSALAPSAMAQTATGDNPAPAPAEGESRVIDFKADKLDYDSEAETVVASGNVRMMSEGNRVRADQVSWDRTTGRVIATGNVAATTAEGDTAYGDRVELTDTLRDAVVDNILLVLERGGRIAARSGSRTDGRTVLSHAVYSPCDVVNSDGCPTTPLWQVKAVEVVHDPSRHRIFYRDARMEILGVPLIWLPRMSHPDGSGASGSGLLVPDVRISRVNGVELSFPYYLSLSQSHDLTVTPHVYTEVLPALEVEYRRMTSMGPFKIGGIGTYGSRVPASELPLPGASERDLRGYVYGNGRFQFDPLWRMSFSGRVTTDDTFLRRYDISRDDRLRSFAEVERIGLESYLSIAGWAVQSLRTNDDQGQQPFALPAIDYRWQPSSPVAGGRLEVHANSLSLVRTDGQDTRRALASVQWDMRKYTPMGQVVTLTGFARGDVYQTEQSALTANALYRGEEGWQTRGIAAAAVDISWPLAGPALGGIQTLTPRIQFVGSPGTSNLSIPNEDSRAVDLEDSNLFALNRFPGYDRWEDGSRVTWGAEWSLNVPGFSVRSVVGQSYRLTDKPSLFPQGTGLTDRFSDFVGRTTFRWRDYVSIIHRFRLDKDNLALRRNEINATVGTRQTYVTVGYLRLDRNILLEDLGDREEIRLGARWRFARYWSVYGSTIVDLTSRREDPLTIADGFEPIRHRVGLAYEDECFEFGVTWRRDYVTTGDARRANTYLFRIALKNLGY
ncbi:organic solvent tolerance protein [Tardibacter chloracetimidivorans]|uniref:LPS-assembly protein LptD n=2 Tax=Tardibacter chloracetimidivorans TaxID=1921510 RepID=A0A1L3ZZ31_9SPHN|nr:organic solvent tolerance protein [Tardibacter chloracetimidivorans]